MADNGEYKEHAGSINTPRVVTKPPVEKKRGTLLSDDIPDLTSIPEPDELRAEKEAAEVRRQKSAAFLAAVPGAVNKLLRTKKELAGTKLAQDAEITLRNQILDVSDPVLRISARWLYANEYLMSSGVESSSGEDVLGHLGGLGLIVKIIDVDDKKPARIGHIRLHYGRDMFVPSDDYPADMKAVVERVFARLRELANQGRTRAIQSEDEERHIFLEGVKRSWVDLMALEPGTYVLSAPPSQFQGTRDNVPAIIHVAGGMLRVESTGGKVTLVDTFGSRSFCNGLVDAVNEQVSFSISDMEYERLQLSAVDKRTMTEIQRKALFRFFSHMRRSYLAHLEIQEKKGQADLASEKATISFTDFLLEKKDGVAFIKHANFARGEEKYRHPWILVGRENGKVGIVETNTSELFRTCIGSSYEEGEDFGGVPQPLAGFLRLAVNKARKFVEEEADEHARQEDMRQWVEEQKAQPTGGSK